MGHKAYSGRKWESETTSLLLPAMPCARVLESVVGWARACLSQEGKTMPTDKVAAVAAYAAYQKATEPAWKTFQKATGPAKKTLKEALKVAKETDGGAQP